MGGVCSANISGHLYTRCFQVYRVSPEVKEALLLNLVDDLCCPLLALVVCLAGRRSDKIECEETD